MKKIICGIALALALSFAPSLKAQVTVGHIENAGTGQFFNTTGAALTSGGVSIGFFPTTAPLDGAFGSTIRDWTSLLAAGYVDVRSVTGATLATGFDWDFPGVGGSVLNIPIAALPAGTQLYLFGFDVGTLNLASPALSTFQAATAWAVVKDTANLSPPNLGLRTVLLNTASGTSEVLVGTDSGINVNLAPIPEPSSMILIGVGVLGLLGGRRRNARAC